MSLLPTSRQKELSRLVTEVTDNLEHVANKSGAEASEALVRASKGLAKAAEHMMQDLTDTGEHAVDGVVSEAKAHPLLTTALVASAAALVGFVASRSLSHD